MTFSNRRLALVLKIALPLALAIVLMGIALATWLRAPAFADKAEPAAQVTPVDTTIDVFLKDHWSHPIAPQGQPPAHFSPLEASLQPASCGACHQEQFASWQHSLHSKTMTAGVLWQLQLMPPEQVSGCLNCHAPLAEQRALVAKELGFSNAPKGAVPDYVGEDLAHQGLVCAACHVRAHQRFGPEPQAVIDPTQLAHAGFSTSPAYSDSRFCASCHQFPEDGPRTAGKLREDTFAEWQASRFATREPVQHCQSCHMPNRQHEWKGIHDPAMVRQALSHSLARIDDTLVLTLTNSGAGHKFPTYMVPKIHIEIWLEERGTRTRLSEDIIGWHVETDLAREQFDTRLSPGQSREFIAALPTEVAAAAHISVELRVMPREHYERSFESVLAQRDKLTPATLKLLEQAHREATTTRFTERLLHQPLSEIVQKKSR